MSCSSYIIKEMIIATATLRWLLCLLIPYFFGMVIHLIVPLQFMLDSFPKSEQVYNGYKLQSQQNAVRTLAILKQKIIRSRIQLKQRSVDTFLKIYADPSPYYKINISDIKINFAGNVTENQPQEDVSMWFAQGINQVSQMDVNQKKAFDKYVTAQPFIRATLPISSSKDLPTFRMLMNYSGSPILFEYPTRKNIQYESPDFDPQTQCFNLCRQNWDRSNLSYTSQWDKGQLEICHILLENKTTVGAICLREKIQMFAKELTILGTPTFSFSTNTYMLMTPVYGETDMPQILFYFSDLNLTNVTYPTNQTFEIPPQDSRSYWQSSNISYQMHLYQLNEKETYFQTPILVNGVDGRIINILLLVVKNEFVYADFDYDSKTTNILVSILIPSTVLLFLSLAISVFAIKFLLNDLQSGIQDLNSHCQHILKQNLDVKIPCYGKTQDISSLYEVCEILNKLYKVSCQNFYTGPHPQRLLKYYQVYKLFEQLGYDVSNVVQILGNCSFNMKDYAGATKFFKQAIDCMTVDIKTKRKHDSLLEIGELKTRKSKKLNKQGYDEKLLRKRLFKLILCHIWSIQPPFQNAELQEAFILYKRVTRGKINSETVAVYLMECRIFFGKKQLEKAYYNIKKAEKIMLAYEDQYNKGKFKEKESNNDSWSPPTVTRSYFELMLGIYNFMTGKIPVAFGLFVKALEGNQFAPDLNSKVADMLKKLLQSQNLLTPQVLATSYLSQLKQSSQREVLFLFDWTRNRVSTGEGVRKWRKDCIKRAHNIFDNFLEDGDRLSLVSFDDDVHILCSLTPKGKNQAILKCYIDNLKSEKASRVNPSLKRALTDTINRVKNLSGLKVIICFLKNQTIVYQEKILPILLHSGIQKYKLIFLKLEPSEEPNPHWFILQLNNQQDFDRLMMRKKQASFSNEINPY